MKASGLTWFAAVLMGAVGVAGSAVACNGGGGGGGFGGGGYGGIGRGGNGGVCVDRGDIYNRGNGSNYGRAYEPFHGNYFVQPGDSFYEVSLKEYGSSAPLKYIAQYNRMAPDAALIPGQQLLLPSINSRGQLSASRAPRYREPNSFPVAESTAKYAPASSAKPSLSSVAESTPDVERSSVPSGSVIQLDGQSLGEKPGVVRLRINNVALPVEVVEWTAESTKVRLPKLDVTGTTNAELEIVRADGSLAATNAVELTMPTSGLAASN